MSGGAAVGISFMPDKVGGGGEPSLGWGWEEPETPLSASSQEAFRADSGAGVILRPMNPQSPDPRAIARRHAERKRSRIHLIRKRVATLTVTVFIAIFAVIYVQMVEGNDPALSKTTSTTAASPSSSGSSTSSDSSSTSSDSSSTSSDNSSTSSDDSSSSSDTGSSSSSTDSGSSSTDSGSSNSSSSSN